MQEETHKTSPWLWVALGVVVVGAAAFFAYNYFSTQSATSNTPIDDIMINTSSPTPQKTTSVIEDSVSELNDLDQEIGNIDKDLNEIDSIDITEDTPPTL